MIKPFSEARPVASTIVPLSKVLKDPYGLPPAANATVLRSVATPVSE